MSAMTSARGRLRRLRADLRADLRARRIAAAARRDLTPPPPGAYARYGRRSLVLPPARVQLPGCIEIGDDVMIHEHAWLCLQQMPGRPTPRLAIGDRTSINRFVKVVCVGEVVLGDDVLVGDNVYIGDTTYTNDDPDLPVSRQPLAPAAPVRIGNGAHIGVRVLISPGVTIGEHAYVGAGAVVTEDVPPRCVAVGNPARVVRHYDAAAADWLPGAPG